MKHVLLIMFAALAAAVGAASSVDGSYLRPEDHGVAAIIYRLSRAGVPLCPDSYPLTGLLFHHLADYDAAARPQAAAAYGIDRGPGVATVLADSPAAQAGLAAGDALLAVNGVPFDRPRPVDHRRRGWRDAAEASETILEEQLSKGPARLLVLRGGRSLELTLGSVPGCPGRVRLARSSQVNAFASGRYVVATTGVLGFVRGDDELAVVVAHELAHNILGHPARLRAQDVPRGFLRGIGKNASRVRVTEEEADRLGIRLLFLAGYDVGAAIPFWRRYYARFDRIPQLFRTHPGLQARERLISETIAELEAGKAIPGTPRR